MDKQTETEKSVRVPRDAEAELASGKTVARAEADRLVGAIGFLLTRPTRLR